MTGRLYGLPGADTYYADPDDVWEYDIAPSCDEDAGPWPVEERAVADPREALPDPADILGWVHDWIGDADGYMDQCPIENIEKDADALRAAEALLDVIASKFTWFEAGELIATHTIDAPADPDGPPIWDRPS